jgi:hypothetical protein
MDAVRTSALLAALLLGTSALAAPVQAEVRPALRIEPPRLLSGNPVLRALPAAAEPPGAYARLSRWISEVWTPGPDGKPKLVVVTVPGGLGLGWARRW